MKKNLFLFGLAIGMVALGNVHATEHQEEEKAEEKISLKTRDGIELGVQNYWYKYEEEVNGNFFMSNEGNKYGASLTGIMGFADEYYVIGDARYATGDVKYKSASGTGDVSDKMYELRVIVGNEALIENYLLSSYIGVGYRRLDNDLRDLGQGGYRRESEYLYVPIGVMHRFRIGEQSRVSSAIEYDYFVKGEQKSYLSDVGPAYAAFFGDPVNKQNHGYGVRINSTYERSNWSIGAFLNYWKIDDSEVNYYLDYPWLYSFMEPKNDTKEIGLQIKYRFN